MSVSKLQHDAFSVGPQDPGSSQDPRPLRESFTIVPSKSDATEFWTHFNQTLDEFFRTISASKAHIRRLSDEVAERDQRIELLTAENAALREQIEASDASNHHANERKPQDTAHPQIKSTNGAPRETAPESRSKRSIWSRLSGFEDPTPLEDRNF